MPEIDEAKTPTELKIDTTLAALTGFIDNSNIDPETQEGLYKVILAHIESYQDDCLATQRKCLNYHKGLYKKWEDGCKRCDMWEVATKQWFKRCTDREWDDVQKEIQAEKRLSANADESTPSTIGKDEVLDFADMLHQAEKRQGS